MNYPPTVLVIAGNDPSGGAGLCADIQTLTQHGCHTAPVVTCITTQNTSKVLASLPLAGDLVANQAKAVLQDMTVAVCKIGLLGNIEIVEAVQSILQNYPNLPIILDPVLASGNGQSLTQKNISNAIISKILPLITVITPNSLEARILTNENKLETAAQKLIDYGCKYVCITGTHEKTDMVINTLYGEKSWTWTRLPHNYHGSGCTFASSLAGNIAQGEDITTAVYKAQNYTWNSLYHGYKPGHGQHLPMRVG
ncbi:MAG: bifunctional hydroxymethylpyrimidine kinase/phosphomethylpyrimidine kinase [Proteobacteria bacterium]|nr:bifunctional hydroxymethylpyrimidine kinase/phosphomethylpyrimidine kinase [Pseudomonadota bacterium]